jgi:hypothetical protein
MKKKALFDLEEEEFLIWQKFKNYPTPRLLKSLQSSNRVRRVIAAKELQIRGEKTTFEYACILCNSHKSPNREIGAFILGQLGTPKFPFANLSKPILSNLALNDVNENVRAAAVSGLGHFASLANLKIFAKGVHDPKPSVRVATAFALSKLKGEKRLLLLMKLAKDKNSEVRSWAVFGLRQHSNCNVNILNTLASMLDDSSKEVKAEVICGLAECKDKRAFRYLKIELDEEEIFFDFIEAAGNLGDRRILPKLKKLYNEWGHNSPPIIIDAINKLNSNSK